MSKNRRYIFSFVFTLLVLGFLWLYNQKNTEIGQLKEETFELKQELDEVKSEYQACKGEIYHKQKLLEMEKRKANQLSLDSTKTK